MTGEINYICPICGYSRKLNALYGKNVVIVCENCGKRNQITRFFNKRSQLRTLDTLTEALGSSEGQSTEEIKEELRNDGIDVDGILLRLQDTQKRISKKSKEHYG